MLRIASTVLLLTSCQLEPELEEWTELRWTAQYSGVGASLRGVSAVGGDVCWASGGGGTWLRTIDGGTTWTAGIVPGAEERDFRDVEAFGPNRALLMAVASPAEFWFTEDGGATWRLTWSLDHPDVFLDAMAFWDERRGLAWGDPIDDAFCVLATEDGGESWARIDPTLLPAPAEGEAGFAASGTCLAVGAHGRAWIATGGSRARVLRTGDFGATWTAHETPMAAGKPSTGGFSILVLEDGRGALVGGDYENPEARRGSAAFTIDDGRTWHPCTGEAPGYRSSVCDLGGGTLLAVGKVGASLSFDCGGTWGLCGSGTERWMPPPADARFKGPDPMALYAIDMLDLGEFEDLSWGDPSRHLGYGVGPAGAVMRLWAVGIRAHDTSP